MDELRIVDVVDPAGFELLPPCADPGFDHRTCDYWEDAARGSRAHRPAWLRPAPTPAGRPAPAFNPFAPDESQAIENPFARAARPAPVNLFAVDEGDDPVDNPFAPTPRRPKGPPPDAPRKLVLLGRGLGVFGSYAKVLVASDGAGERPVAYAQFGPLSAYPRALRVRDLYPALPATPLPAVITCIATTPDARRSGLALRLMAAICDDLAGRGFAAVEAYPEAGAAPDATSAATPAFWVRAGFRVVVDDERFPVVRREL